MTIIKLRIHFLVKEPTYLTCCSKNGLGFTRADIARIVAEHYQMLSRSDGLHKVRGYLIDDLILLCVTQQECPGSNVFFTVVDNYAG
jgi:hypothetical protein